MSQQLEVGYRAAAQLIRDKEPPLTKYSAYAAGINALMRARAQGAQTAARRAFIDGKLDEMLEDFCFLPESRILH